MLPLKRWQTREWRNWQTRTFEGRVVTPYGFKSRFSHQQKAPEQKLRCFFVVASFWLANPPDAKRRYGQCLSFCVANDGLCPSRQTCRFATRNMFNLSRFSHQSKKFIAKQSLSRLRRQLPLHKGAFLFTYALSIFLTSTAFVGAKAKPRARRGKYQILIG